MLGISAIAELIAFAGKSKVYFRRLGATCDELGNNGEKEVEANNGNSVTFPGDLTFPDEWTSKNCHIECIAISKDGELIAVADSAHGLNIFERKSEESSPQWRLIFSGASSKRTIKLQFTTDKQYLSFLDKQGDIFAVHISKDNTEISSVKKLMGHTSFISDYVTREEKNQIISCDRDEKIRISNFPDAFIIQGFKLGHTESVISLALLRKHGYLLSISVSGWLILWDMNTEVEGTSTSYLKKWNLKDVLPKGVQNEVAAMKACSFKNDILLSVTHGQLTTVNVLKITLPSQDIAFLYEIETGSAQITMEWACGTPRQRLVVFSPTAGTLKVWEYLEANNTMACESDFPNFSSQMIEDLKALAEIHKSANVPMWRQKNAPESSVPSSSANREFKMQKA